MLQAENAIRSLQVTASEAIAQLLFAGVRLTKDEREHLRNVERETDERIAHRV